MIQYRFLTASGTVSQSVQAHGAKLTPIAQLALLEPL